MRATLELVDVPTTTIPDEDGVLLVAVLANGNMLVSSDGAVWTQITTPIPTGFGGWASIRHASGLWVAGGLHSGVAKLFSSPDGHDWAVRESDAGDSDPVSVVFGDGVWVAVLEAGDLWSSSDAETWTQRTVPSGATFSAAAHHDGLFVATGQDGYAITSPDGATWTQRATGSSDSNGLSVAAGGGLYVAVAQRDEEAYVSSDGIAWDDHPMPAGEWYGVHYADGLFVAVGWNGTTQQIVTSPDGETWTSRTTADDDFFLTSVGWSGLWIAGGLAGVILTSPDAVTWTQQDTGGVTSSVRRVAGASP